MRLDVNDPKVFDRWRELYYDLTHEENIAFGNAMEEKYPHQASFDSKLFSEFFSRLERPVRVVEVGGWKGELARHICAEHAGKVTSWHNIDMCRAAILATPNLPIPYSATFPSRFDWFTDSRETAYDLFVSAHTIEHLTGKHLRSLLDWLRGIPDVVLEAPIGATGQSWKGFEGTHILEMGWKDIHLAMEKRGYRNRRLSDWCYHYELKGSR